MSTCTTYLRPSLTPDRLREVIDALGGMIYDLMATGVHLDAIAVRGMSGAIVGGALSVKIGLPLVVVRKESAHSGHDVECVRVPRVYVIVDDLIDTGKTINAILRGVCKVAWDSRLPVPECAAILLYLSRAEKTEFSSEVAGPPIPIKEFYSE